MTSEATRWGGSQESGRGARLPVGDFDRAELGSVNPFRYLDVVFDYKFQFRSKGEVAFIHEGAAVNLLCPLAQVVDRDECSGSEAVSDFRVALAQGQGGGALRTAFFETDDQFHSSLTCVLTEVIFPTFHTLARELIDSPGRDERALLLSSGGR